MTPTAPSELRRISKTMSWLLRHNAVELGLCVDPEGYVAISDVVEILRAHHALITREALLEVVERVEPAKQRFQLAGDWIRANYGHSLASKVQHETCEPPHILLHGTSEDSATIILQTGLHPMRRQYVHLTTDADLASAIGTRHGQPCILAVDARQAHEHAVMFYRANERFWLADSVPAEYLSRAPRKIR